MSISDPVPWKSLEKSSAGGFVVGGVAWFTLIALTTTDTTIGVSPPSWLLPALLVVGLLTSYVGLLGFYPHVADSAPRLSLAGVVITAFAAMLVVLALTYNISTGTFTEGPPFPVFPLVLLSTVLSFSLLGIASVLTSTPSRIVGILLVVPAIAWVGDIVFIVLSSVLGVESVAGIDLMVIPMIGVLVASVAMITTGYLLHTGSHSIDWGEPSPDSTA